jgi:hypothetical protein
VFVVTRTIDGATPLRAHLAADRPLGREVEFTPRRSAWRRTAVAAMLARHAAQVFCADAFEVAGQRHRVGRVVRVFARRR